MMDNDTKREIMVDTIVDMTIAGIVLNASEQNKDFAHNDIVELVESPQFRGMAGAEWGLTKAKIKHDRVADIHYDDNDTFYWAMKIIRHRAYHNGKRLIQKWLQDSDIFAAIEEIREETETFRDTLESDAERIKELNAMDL